VLDALIIFEPVVPVDEGAFHDVSASVLVTPTLFHSLPDQPFTALNR
jgi:hypothetical protein